MMTCPTLCKSVWKDGGGGEVNSGGVSEGETNQNVELEGGKKQEGVQHAI